ncbi:MAG: ATP-binding protein [Bacteroidota bacterium]
MYKREIENIISKYLDNDKILILYGPRQTGKTTFIEYFLKGYKHAKLLNCEHPEIFDILSRGKPEEIALLLGNNKIIALDEAQVIPDIGKKLKLIYDTYGSKYKIIATGSSSFELSGKLHEPLTGRNLKFNIFPLSYREIIQKHDWLWWRQKQNEMLIYGTYPGIIDLPVNDKKLYINSLASDYLFKDIVNFENIRNSDKLRKLLKALAWQVGSQVSYNELAQTVGMSQPTVVKYLDLLEKSFIIFKLSAFSKNLRNELKKSYKYYFIDNGIRNAVIQNFSPMHMRNDSGALWENYCISERMKYVRYVDFFRQLYFWRTYDGSEIDLIEQTDEKIYAFDFKFGKHKKHRFSKSFVDTYKPKQTKTINPDTIHDFLAGECC